MTGGANDGLTELEGLVAEFFELEAAERDEWIERLARRSDSLAEEVLERLGALGELGLCDRAGDEPPRRLGGHDLIERVGLGGMGEVWRASDGTRDVAIKVVRPELLWFEGAKKRFERESRALCALDHPGIVRVLEVGQEGELPWMALEWVDGASLEALLSLLRGRSPESLVEDDLLAPLFEGASPAIGDGPAESHASVVAHLLARVADALHHAHGAGVVHRDVKPSNVLVARDGRVLLVDFGLVLTREGSRFTRSGSWLGSLPYAPPEQIDGEGEVDARADVYSLGATLYECLCLQTPFLGGAESMVRARILAADLPSVRRLNPAVPRSLELVCARAMDRNPARRYPNAKLLADDLRAAAAGRPVAARGLPLAVRVARFATRRPRIAVAAAFALLAWVVVASWAWRERVFHLRVQRLADVELVERLEREAPGLWPPDPDRIAELDAWLDEADRLLGRRDVHGAERDRLRARGLPYDAGQRERDRATTREALLDLRLELEGLAHFLAERTGDVELPAPAEPAAIRAEEQRWTQALDAEPETFLERALERIEGVRASVSAGSAAEAELDQLASFERELRRLCARLDARTTYRFESDFDGWRHDQLDVLLARLDALAAIRVAVEGLRERCLEMRTLSADVLDAWRLALPSIAEAHDGLALEPNPVLRPLGVDPRTGRWEFLLVGTGATPERDETGRFAPDRSTGVVLVLLPGGLFEMGAPLDSPSAALPGVLPRHRVELAPFLISKYELTVAQAERMGSLPEEAAYQRGDGAMPLRLGWEEARRLIASRGLLHPTEAQWEYAALGGASGTSPAAATPTVDAGGTGFAPVGGGDPNVFGLHDVFGNVSEWCRDWLILRGYASLPSRPGDGLKTTTLRGPGRVVRGALVAGDARADPYARTLGHAAAAPTTGVRPVFPLAR